MTMTPADKLRHIINIANGDNLERAQLEYKRLIGYDESDEIAKNTRIAKYTKEIIDDFQKQRTEWQAAKDLLESMLKERGL
jgi:hypothetical protein